MQRKILQVQVELEVQAVTCPGVWLCPNGQVSLQMYMLDSKIQTATLRPAFPLLYHEKFIFYKVFESARNLSDLQSLINSECFYAELIQWQNCEGNVISSFQSTLGDLLYPSSYNGSIAGIDIDLLMEPTKNFPGIIAPKIEVNTRTTVEEIFANANSKCTTSVINPKVVQSDQLCWNAKPNSIHQQKVCHSVGYHRARQCVKTRRSNKPPFVFRKVDEKLINRKPDLFINSESKCDCCSKGKNFEPEQILSNIKQYRKDLYNKCKRPLRGYCPNGTQMCLCGSGHTQGYCPVCCKYNQYFKEDENVKAKDDSIIKAALCRITPEVCQPGNKNILHQAFAMKVNPCPSCYCSSRELRTCMCSPTSDNKPCNKICCSSDQGKLTLAEKIHNRIKQTFDCTSGYVYRCGCDSPMECGCPKYSDCSNRLYKGIGKFYRDLQKC